MRRFLAALPLLLAGTLSGAIPSGAQDLLPDVIIEPTHSFVTRFDTTTLPGRTLLRLSTATANDGEGRLELRSGQVTGPERREVFQRIYRADGSFWERLAGEFVFHDEHDHFHFEDWTAFRLYEVGSGGEVGALVREGAKTSFCLLDLLVHDASNPGYRRPGFYTTCGDDVQGITPGWSDLYNFHLPDQWIDITGLPDGVYWLEAEVDPEDRVVESDEANNRAGRLVAVFPLGIEADPYEENDSFEQVRAREPGAPGSPNLGLVNARLEIPGLSMDDLFDYFLFRTNNTGGAGDFVRIEATQETGDIDLYLYAADRSELGRSEGPTSLEQLSLEGLPAGEYFAVVRRFRGDVPGYVLTIDPAANGPPVIEVVQPAWPGIYVERALETVPVEWIVSDPEGDPTRVSLFMDRDRIFDKGTLPIGGYQDLRGEDGVANLNTALMELGPWTLYAEVTDGGALAGGFAPGRFVVYEKGDLDYDGDVDRRDLLLALRRLLLRLPPKPPLDMDRDGDVDRRDFRLLVRKFREERRARRSGER